MVILLLSLSCLCILGGHYARGQDDVTFMALGDWGTGPLLETQQNVADAVATWAENELTDFIVSTGDNFYPFGVYSVDDEQFDTKWRNVYNHTSLENIPWYLCLGNHDYGRENSGNEWYQVEFSKVEPDWIMPYLWFSFYKDLGNEKIHFVVLDTEAIKLQVNNYTTMLQWFEEELSNSVGYWKIVIAHDPIYSSGGYGPVQNDTLGAILPILEKHNVDLYLSGHDHNLQHLQKETELSQLNFIISGAGGSFTYPKNIDFEQELDTVHGVKVKHFSEAYGFAALKITKEEVKVNFIDEDNVNLYEVSIVKNSGRNI